MLKELGLLSEGPVEVDGTKVAPKRLVDAVLYPRGRLQEGERDIVLFRVEAVGKKQGAPCRLMVEMVDRYDETLGFTSIGRTTACTGAIVARMIAQGEIKVKGLLTPELVITGPLLNKLVGELEAVNVRFEETTEEV